jgi:hypothetical protein
MAEPRALRDKWKPTNDQKRLAHDDAIRSLEQRMAGVKDENPGARDVALMPTTGKTGRAFGPQYKHQVEQYKKAFPKAYGSAPDSSKYGSDYVYEGDTQ